ncbi:MAG: MerR family DNA-binding transcriptional regulator [Gammaproteobacteria bacterium]|nr:MerR family DNA-binding transcriptional regulator [Gammaproteobacteria bacterium]
MSDDRDRLYTVTELADRLGVTARAIRFYETKGLLSPRRAGSTRVYNYRDRARLQLILRSKKLGFSLADIREYLDLYDPAGGQREQQQLLLRKVRDRIESLQQQQEALDSTLSELREIEASACRSLQQRK